MSRLYAGQQARVTIAVLALSLFAGNVHAQSGDLSLPGLDGGQLRESEIARGAHIVVFWTSWSPRGRDIVDRVNGLVDRWGGRAAVHTINFQEDESTVRAFLKGKSALKAGVFLDESGEFSKKHRVNSAPWLLVVKDGQPAFSEKLPRDADSLIAQILG